jgi:hypothetical protein
MVEPLNGAELAVLVEKLRTLYADHTAEQIPNTLTMAEVESIYSLKNSSNRLEKLTEELSKSSIRLERYTYRLMVFTLVLIFLTIVLIVIPSDFPMWAKGIAIVLAVVMVVKAYSLKKKE